MTEEAKDVDSDILETIELKSKDPMEMFKYWFQAAKDNPENILPEAMTLATIRKDGGPSARTVLLRGLDDEGFKMYWDFRSRKSAEIDADNRGSLVFRWTFRNKSDNLGSKQVRIEGILERLSEEEATEYFNTEPISSQIRATVCHQSQVVPDDRKKVIAESLELLEKFKKGDLTLTKPSHWGGYRLRPDLIEFYQGQRDSINDRIRFRRKDCVVPDDLPLGVYKGDNGWVYERLEP